MNKALHILICCLIVHLSSAYAEVYKWVDDQGNIHYSDKKPENETIEQIKLKVHVPDLTHMSDRADNVATVKASDSAKPYKKQYKVTMYSASWCGYCKKARAYFQENKIRYVEYDIEKNSRAKNRYQQLGGTGVPLLVAKRNKMQGFSAPEFERWYAQL